MKWNKTQYIAEFIKGIIKSYSIIFFSSSKLFGTIILLTTFFDVYAAICGLLCVVLTNIFIHWFGYNRNNAAEGLYGFNSLLVGLGLGHQFEFTWYLIAILFLASLLTVFITLVTEAFLSKYTLPFLSIPFLIGIWTMLLATRSFDALSLTERNIYILNDIYSLGGKTLLDAYQQIQNAPLPHSLKTYFISLGAIFFQYKIYAGILISIGLLIFSRIAFTLSLLGFYSAYFFYYILGININELSYSYIGFNYILTAIAVGGFFIIPSWHSYLWTIILIPIVAFVSLSTAHLINIYQLSIYSLPFNIVVLLFVYVLKLRVNRSKTLAECIVQHGSPERNLYNYVNYNKRFKGSTHIPLRLPFWGEWFVSQAFNGNITHKDDWCYAWDFVIVDENLKTYNSYGRSVDDYYCYQKIILSPADGTIEEIIDGIEDNAIGSVNLNENWGNCIVIKHSHYLYSKLCHLKAGSFKVNKGDFVRKGQPIALVGNSGRSPEPHLHFQLQATPYVGSRTIKYPIAYFIVRENAAYQFKTFDYPTEKNIVSNIEPNDLIKKSFTFIPGQQFEFEVTLNKKTYIVKWEVFTDIYNHSYIYCKQSNSFAYFINDGYIMQFTKFIGNRKSLLYYFFLATYKIQFGFYPQLSLKDYYPIHFLYYKNPIRYIQDFIAPFKLFLQAEYILTYENKIGDISTESVILTSKVITKLFRKKKTFYQFTITLANKGLKTFTISHNNQIIEAVCKNL